MAVRCEQYCYSCTLIISLFCIVSDMSDLRPRLKLTVALRVTLFCMGCYGNSLFDVTEKYIVIATILN